MWRLERQSDQGLVLSPRQGGSSARRSRSTRGARPAVDPDELDDDLSRILERRHRTETKRGVSFNVQAVTAASAVKEYVCPGCSVPIAPALPHLVTWRAEGVLGDEADLAARRHWHTHCWRIS